MHQGPCRLVRVILAAAFLSLPLVAQPPAQVADLNTTSYDGPESFLAVSEFAELSGMVYFTAPDILHGWELWKTDGTEGGTVRVTDLCPGACDSWPRNLAVVGASTYFSADDGAHGLEPWISDGTAAGTRMIEDAVLGVGGSAPYLFTAVNGRILYVATDFQAGQELWTTDGTEGGTQRLVDIWPGPQGSGATPWQVVGTDLFFSADDGVHGLELWATDGTVAGTRMVRDIFPGALSSVFSFFPFPGFNRTAVLGSRIFFAAADSTNDYELWASDGTEAGTTRVGDLAPGPADSSPQFFETLGSVILFTARDTVTGQELWRTDGTEAGTTRVKDIVPGSDSSSPYELTRFGNAVFFHAQDAHGRELWKSDGTEAGTTLVKDVWPGPDSGLGFFYNPHSFTPVGSRLLFFAEDGVTGSELWATDGTPEGTVQVTDLNPGALGADGGSFGVGHWTRFVFGGRWYFRAYDGPYSEGRQLYVSDGTPAGTVRVKRLIEQRSGVALPYFGSSVEPGQTAALNGRLIFVGDDGANGGEPAVSDGTAAGTFALADLFPGADTSIPREMTTVGSRVLFSADPGTSATPLWATDGTTSGTAALTGPPLLNGSAETVTIGSVCGIPATAKAVAFNLTAITPTGAGFLRAYPSGAAPALVSQVNFSSGQTRTNNGTVEIGADGKIVVQAALTGGAVSYVFDVVGYFE